VQGNFIGTDVHGDPGPGNITNGIYVRAGRDTSSTQSHLGNGAMVFSSTRAAMGVASPRNLSWSDANRQPWPSATA